MGSTCHICIESPFHLPPTQGKFSDEACPLDISLPFKNLYVATISLLWVCLLFHPCMSQVMIPMKLCVSSCEWDTQPWLPGLFHTSGYKASSLCVDEWLFAAWSPQTVLSLSFGNHGKVASSCALLMRLKPGSATLLCFLLCPVDFLGCVHSICWSCVLAHELCLVFCWGVYFHVLVSPSVPMMLLVLIRYTQGL